MSSQKSIRLLNALILSGLTLFGLTSCNLYGGIDNPSGDAQILSKARAYLDAQDYKDALSEYALLSSNYSDVQNSEEAYATFAEFGASMEAFASGFGNGQNVNVGTGFTAMADSILATTVPGATTRKALYDAFIKYQGITDNPKLSGLVEVLGATAIASEVLAEMAETNGASTLTCADVSDTNAVANCSTGGGPLGACAASGSCGTQYYSDSTIGTGTATLDMLNAALLNIQDGISRIGGSGSLNNVFQSAFSINGNSISGSSPCSGIPGVPSTYILGMQMLHMGGC